MLDVFSAVIRQGLRLALTVALAAWIGGQAQAGQYGSIKGRLVYSGGDVPAPRVLIEKGRSEKDPTVCAGTATIYSKALLVDPKTKGVRDAFAYLVRPKGSNPDALKTLLSKAETVVIDQKNCEFVPYATAVHQEQAIEFKSSDAANHNVNFHAFTNSPFNLVMAPQQTAEKRFFAERRPISLTCDIHPWMKAWIMVFDHPFFAVTGEDGSFEIRGVPAGAQKLVVWQESVGYSTPGGASGMPVTVEADQTTDVGAVKLDASRVRN